MCYVGRLKDSMYLGKCEAGSQNRCKNLANTRLDLRNAANSLQIEGNGVLPGDPYHWRGDLAVGRRDHIYIYIYTYNIRMCVV